MQPDACSSPPCNGPVLRAPSFPILTLDERRLTPSLGYVFNRKWLHPCESLISIVWNFEKADALPGHVVARLMGPDIDPHEGIVPQLGTVDIQRLRDTLAVPMKTLRTSLLLPSHRRRYSGLFRYCHRCVARGYHSVLHQMEGVGMCPAHRQPLETACRRCGYEAQCLASVQLLEAPYRCAYCRASYGVRGALSR
ncbi:hypothetical protein [Paraburkholderia sp. 32]|uniref:hypothetical protein n=1 Tax=Paraburkholderia sp. 32 TaxID=2991057 RepID=UPI003D22CEFF